MSPVDGGGRPRVVIVGAGYAGLGLAVRLARRAGTRLRIELVDGHAEHHLVTRLHEVAAGRLARAAVAIPLRRVLAGTDVQVTRAWVDGLDAARGAVSTTAGWLPYDVLVVAPGSEPDFHDIPGASIHGHPLRTLDDALALRDQIEQRVFDARLETRARQWRELAFVLVGGGYTGVELAGELAERLRSLAARASLSRDAVRIVIVEAADHLMPGHDAWLGRRARDGLEHLGITVFVSTPVLAVEADGVSTPRGRLEARTVIWTTGIRGPAWLAQAGLPTGPDGRLLVDAYLRVRGQETIVALGDAALVEDPTREEPFQPTAQIAVQQASHLADALLGGLRGERPRPFVPRVLGEAVSLGQSSGLARVAGVPLEDGPALAAKRLAQARYLEHLGGARLALRQHALAHLSARAS